MDRFEEGTNVAASGAAAGDQPPAKSKKKIVVIVLAVVALLVAVAGALLVLNKPKDDEDMDSKTATVAVPTFLPLENLVVNLADPGGDRFIQLGITLELRDEKVAERVKQYMPSIRDGILRLVSQHTADDLLGREGKEQLALAIRKEVGRPLGGERRRARAQDDDDEYEDDLPPRRPVEPVRRVLFSSFIIQ